LIQIGFLDLHSPMSILSPGAIVRVNASSAAARPKQRRRRADANRAAEEGEEAAEGPEQVTTDRVFETGSKKRSATPR
jgi:hypothetical protein